MMLKTVFATQISITRISQNNVNFVTVLKNVYIAQMEANVLNVTVQKSGHSMINLSAFVWQSMLMSIINATYVQFT